MGAIISRVLPLGVLYICAALSGWFFTLIGSPLPWMIGPLAFSAAAYISGPIKVPVPVKTRPFGQMTVAAHVGLSFTPVALATLLQLAPLLIGMAIISALCALLVGIVTAKISGMRLPQAILSTFPTSPVEAAIMAETYGCDPAPVILSQTIRIACVVILIPMIIFGIDGWPDRNAMEVKETFSILGFGALTALALCGAFLFRKLKLSNPYFLGPLFLSSLVAASGLALPSVPPIGLAAAQIILGTWLGSVFTKELFIGNRRMVLVSLLGTILLLGLVSGCAVAMAAVSGQKWEVLVLGAAPGGVTEMALTARYLGVDIALVTAFQLTRIFIFMPNIPWIIRVIDRWEKKRIDRP